MPKSHTEWQQKSRINKKQCFYVFKTSETVVSKSEKFHITVRLRKYHSLGAVQKLRNVKRGEGVDDFVTYRYVNFEGGGGYFVI